MPGSVALPHQLSELALEAGDSPFELVHAVAQWVDFALNKLPCAIANTLIYLCRGLLERLTRESIVEHVCGPPEPIAKGRDRRNPAM